MAVVAKLFTNTRSQFRASERGTYSLSAVCRGEDNAEWSAATPSATVKLIDPVLDELWAAGDGALEVYVFFQPDLEGDWDLESCAFAYSGCRVALRCNRGELRYGGLTAELSINAEAATQSMREAFAAGLVTGVAPRFSLIVRPVG